MRSSTGYFRLFFRNTRHLFRSEYFLDALRITLSIIIPFGVFYYFRDSHTAIAVGVGALLISLTDSPGTLKDKLIMCVYSLCIFFVISLVTALLIKNIILSGLLILICCIIFSLFTAFGKRYALLGTMALILMSFVQGLKPVNPLSFSLYIAFGGLWYYIISLVQTRLWPLSSVRHALGECLMSTSDFLRAKASFYEPGKDLEESYLRVIKLHNKVSEKQEQVRDLLLRNKQLMHEDHVQGQRHLLATMQVIDLYELISAIQYDYESLQDSLKDTGILASITRTIGHLADDLSALGIALSAKSRIKPIDSSGTEIQGIKQQISQLITIEHSVSNSILSKLQDNIDDIYTGIRQISSTLTRKPEEIDFPEDLPAYQLFTVAETISFKAVKSQLTLNAPVFRFALRLSFACLFAYSLMFLPVGFYSYWILLTVIVVIKPGFGLTKKRNIQRLAGTFSGVLIGIVVLAVTSNVIIQLVLAGIFLLGYFVYLRLNYALSILSLTPMVIISLSIYTNNSSVILERSFDTIVGCAIAFAASYLFPSWEVKRHSLYIKDVITANLKYLKKLHDQASGLPFDTTSFKLARKEVYTKLAVLSSGVQNMLLEPRKAQTEIQHLYRFEILSHQLSAIIASFFPFSDSNGHPGQIREKITQAIAILESSLDILDDSFVRKLSEISILPVGKSETTLTGDVEYHKMEQILRISEAVKNQVYLHKFGKIETFSP
ncbi:FUSC family membrane protein [Pedobacter sp. AW31-3R]|uniref:FUSC family protein n=1 Tax=Pedobacter sp. AW31-3R TaxID=3445781 RepID=UPI003FA135C5